MDAQLLQFCVISSDISVLKQPASSPLLSLTGIRGCQVSPWNYLHQALRDHYPALTQQDIAILFATVQNYHGVRLKT